jgi:hypothetical protein
MRQFAVYCQARVLVEDHGEPRTSHRQALFHNLNEPLVVLVNN